MCVCALFAINAPYFIYNKCTILYKIGILVQTYFIYLFAIYSKYSSNTMCVKFRLME